MREMKNSGIPWIGEIPKVWTIELIGNQVKEVNNPNTDGLEDNALQFKMGTIISKSRGDSKYNPETLEGYNIVDKGVIMLNGLNLSFDLISQRVGLVRERGVITSTYLAIKPTKNIDSEYLTYLFKAYDNCKAFHSMGRGLRQTLSYGELRKYLLLYPSLEEQQRIAEFLDRKCAEVDEMIALQEQIIEELKAYKQSVITEAVTKGLNPAAPMRDSGIEWIGQIPEHWEVKPIKYIKSKEKKSFADGPFGSNLKSEHFVENGDVLVIESGFITTGKFIYKDFKTITKEHFETIKRSECKAKDIIIAKIGANYGMSGELPVLYKPSVVSGNSLKITLDNKKYLNPIFVYAMMTAKSNKGFLDLVQENAQPALSLSGLNNFRLPSAPIEEQQAIADYLDDKCADIDSLIQTKQSKIDSLKEYKKSIIYEYVTGKKEVE